MFRKTAAIAVLLALLVPSTALAQQNNDNQQDQGTPTQPFQPLPPAQPTPAPTAEPDDDGGFLDTEISGSATLYIIAAALLVAFVFIGMFISRDARRSLPKSHRPDSHRLREEGPHKHKREAKAKSRARGKAQKAARRRNR
jgi:hypothetical protein